VAVKRPIDLTPRHERLCYQAARQALRGIVDYETFRVTFVNANGPLGWLLQPLTVRGRFQALGSVSPQVLTKDDRVAARIGRFPDGKIPIRFDSRLLRNLDSLKTVAQDEVAEVNAILAFEGEFMGPRDLQQLLETADDLGYRAE
jgi:hypothetical protein